MKIRFKLPMSNYYPGVYTARKYTNYATLANGDKVVANVKAIVSMVYDGQPIESYVGWDGVDIVDA